MLIRTGVLLVVCTFVSLFADNDVSWGKRRRSTATPIYLTDGTFDNSWFNLLSDSTDTITCDATLYKVHAENSDCDAHGDAYGMKLYFHAIFDFHRPSSVPLFLNQVCRHMSLCIPKKNFRIVLHVPENDQIDPNQQGHRSTSILSQSNSLAGYYTAVKFLKDNSIPFASWRGTFDTVAASTVRLWSLKDVKSSREVVLQVDMDEFPWFTGLDLAKIVDTLADDSSHTDVAFGYLMDRLPADGYPANITLATNLDVEFPMLCPLKRTLEKAASRKLVLYRATYRPSVGNHQLMCGESRANMTNCMQKINSHSMRDFFPKLDRTPYKSALQHRFRIDHFKYTWGVDTYLESRVEDFKRAGLPWYKESSSVLKHMIAQGNRICVECPELQCTRRKTRPQQQ